MHCRGEENNKLATQKNFYKSKNKLTNYEAKIKQHTKTPAGKTKAPNCGGKKNYVCVRTARIYEE